MIETLTVAGIPVLAIVPEAEQRLPLVFYVPGYTSAKESGLGFGYKLAQQGCCFVCFDPLLHGERFDRQLYDAADPALGGIYPPDTGLDIGVTFYRVIGQCLADVRTLLDHFAGDERCRHGPLRRHRAFDGRLCQLLDLCQCTADAGGRAHDRHSNLHPSLD